MVVNDILKICEKFRLKRPTRICDYFSKTVQRLCGWILFSKRSSFFSLVVVDGFRFCLRGTCSNMFQRFNHICLFVYLLVHMHSL